jgi:hypothetical protein
MIYELWEVILDEGYSQPFILLKKDSNYNKIYNLFIETIKTKPCAILINLENK